MGSQPPRFHWYNWTHVNRSRQFLFAQQLPDKLSVHQFDTSMEFSQILDDIGMTFPCVIAKGERLDFLQTVGTILQSYNIAVAAEVNVMTEWITDDGCWRLRKLHHQQRATRMWEIARHEERKHWQQLFSPVSMYAWPTRAKAVAGAEEAQRALQQQMDHSIPRGY